MVGHERQIAAELVYTVNAEYQYGFECSDDEYSHGGPDVVQYRHEHFSALWRKPPDTVDGLSVLLCDVENSRKVGMCRGIIGYNNCTRR